MITRAMVNEQLGVYHQRLKWALDGITEEEGRRVLAGRLAPMVWQVGHLAVVDSLWIQRSGGTYALEPHYNDLFKPGTGGEAKYPALTEVWGAFSDVHQALLKALDEADLARPLEHPARAYTSVGGMFVYACYHRGYHVGKAGTLRALLGKPLPVVPPAPG